MRVVSRKKLREFWEQPGRGNSEGQLKTWYAVASNAKWASIRDIKKDFPSVDAAYGRYVFDIKGNTYRLICSLDFVRHGVLVLWLGTHAEYDELTKNDGRKLKGL